MKIPNPQPGDRVTVSGDEFEVIERETDPRRSTYGWYQCIQRSGHQAVVGTIQHLSISMIATGDRAAPHIAAPIEERSISVDVEGRGYRVFIDMKTMKPTRVWTKVRASRGQTEREIPLTGNRAQCAIEAARAVLPGIKNA